MKKLALTLLAATGLFIGTTATSNAGVHFGIYVGHPAYYGPAPVYYDNCAPGYYSYGYYHPYYHHRYYRPYYHRHW